MRSPASPGARVGRSRTACGWSPGTGSGPTHTDRSSTPGWDLVVDVSRQPGQVRSALAALGDRAERWVFVSSGSVYADHSRPGAGLDTPLLPALEGDEAAPETYGEGKVACEEACRAARGDDVLLARSGLIVGYGDRSDRLGYWPGRFALAQEDGGPVLVPERTDRPGPVPRRDRPRGVDRRRGSARGHRRGRRLRARSGCWVTSWPRPERSRGSPARRSRCRTRSCRAPRCEEYMGDALAAAVDRRPRVGGVQRPRHDLGPGRGAERPRADRVAAGRPGLGARAGPGAYGAKGRAGPRRRAGHHRGRPLVARSNYAVLTILGGFRTLGPQPRDHSVTNIRICLPRVHSGSRGVGMIEQPQFRTVLRGFDPEQVTRRAHRGDQAPSRSPAAPRRNGRWS